VHLLLHQWPPSSSSAYQDNNNHTLDVNTLRVFWKGGREGGNPLVTFARREPGDASVGSLGVVASSCVAEREAEELWRERLARNGGRGGRGTVGAGRGAGWERGWERGWSMSWTPLTVLRLAIFGFVDVCDGSCEA